MIGKKIRPFFADHGAVILFIGITLATVPLSGLSVTSIAQELADRIGRNCFLVFSLLFPIQAGMGINFGMVLGAMAGQIGLIIAVDRNIAGAPGLLFGALIAVPIAAMLGRIGGAVLNRAKGREMIASYMLGFFMDGLYQLIVLYLMGTVIPIHSPNMLLSRGYGIRNTLNMDGLRQSLDRLIPLRLGGAGIPVANYLIIGAVTLFTAWFWKTKLGQDMRAVGQDWETAYTAGIRADKTRITAVIISTVLACIGQIIFLQNMGNMAVYNAHKQTGFLAAAALLVGGASVSRASARHVFIGTLLLHLLYSTAPRAGANLFGSAMLGEYFRDAFSYAVIALALALHAGRKQT